MKDDPAPPAGPEIGPESGPQISPQISVVIPHHNDPGLGACLDALAGQRADGVPFEILVVDNGSEALPSEVCAAHPGVRLLSEATPGPGPARSHGAANARAPLIAFIDADCRADPGWIAAIAAAFADPATEIVGGDVRIAPVAPERMTVIEAYESVFGYRQKLYIERDHYAATCNMAVRRAIFAAVGPFAGIGTAEDMDWGRRATAMGYRHGYLPGMRVRTPAQGRLRRARPQVGPAHRALLGREPRQAGGSGPLARPHRAGRRLAARRDRRHRPLRPAGPLRRPGAGAGRRHPAPALAGRADAAPRARRRPAPAGGRLAGGRLTSRLYAARERVPPPPVSTGSRILGFF